MKKIFTLIAATAMAAGVSAQTPGVDTLALSTYDATTKTYAGDYQIVNARPEKAATLPTAPGPFKDAGDAWTNGINFKNNTVATIVIPDGKSVYRMKILGCSQGDNWNYIAAYGSGDKDLNGTKFEFVDPIGASEKDNDIIRTQAKIPVDPCTGVEGQNSQGKNVASTHHAGYVCATLDFGSEPYSGEFPFFVAGNNQHDYAFILYTTREAADADRGTSGEDTDADVVTLALSTYDNTTTDTFAGGYRITGSRPTKTATLPSAPGPFKDAGDAWTDGINFKNNSACSIIIPDSVNVYRIEIFGCSQGDNWNYIYAYGTGDNQYKGIGYEFVDPIGDSEKDNDKIRTTAKIPVDPCTGVEGQNSQGNNVASTHHAGYMCAALDFGNEPYSGEFPFYVAGNNQHDYTFKLYTSRAAADKATTGIASINAQPAKAHDGVLYNLAGQRVSKSYKGVVILNGRKYINK